MPVPTIPEEQKDFCHVHACAIYPNEQEGVCHVSKIDPRKNALFHAQRIETKQYDVDNLERWERSIKYSIIFSEHCKLTDVHVLGNLYRIRLVLCIL